MSAESYRRAVGYLIPVVDRGLTDHDCRAALAFVMVQNPDAALAALEALRDCKQARLVHMPVTVIEDAPEPARGRALLALIRASVRAARHRASRRGGNG